MAKRTIFDCDHCKHENVLVETIELEIGSTFNGTDRDYHTERMDVCIKCLGKILRNLLTINDTTGRVLNNQQPRWEANIAFFKKWLKR